MTAAVDFMQPGSPEWVRTITPSKVAAILGVSKFESPYALWQRMKGNAPRGEHKAIYDVGHDMEAALASRWRRENTGWRLSPGEVQIAHSAEKFGYPCAATLDRRAIRGRAYRIVEFKTTRGAEAWGSNFDDEPPAMYVAQAMAQMLFTGYTKHPAHLMVMNLIGCDCYTYPIEFDAGVAELVHQRCADFYASLAQDVPPDLDDTVATYDVVRSMHPDIDGSTVTLDDAELAWRALQFAVDVKENERVLREAKTRLLSLMGNAQYAEWKGIRIADRRAHAKGGIALSLATKNLPIINTPEGIPA